MPEEVRSLKSYFSVKNLLSFFLGLVLLFWLLNQVDFKDLFEYLFKINSGYLLLGGVIYLCKAAIRAWRLNRLNRNLGTYGSMLKLTLASSLASQLLPFKLGEFVYVYLLRRDKQRSLLQGLSSLMLARVFDLLLIAILFIAISITANVPDKLSIYFHSVVGFVGILLILLIVLLISARYHQSICDRLEKTKLQAMPLTAKTLVAIKNVLQELGQYHFKDYIEWAGLAGVEWFINYWVYHCLLIGMGLQPDLFHTVTAVTLAALASVLPINSFGNFGSQEAGWATGMVLMGYSQATALTTGLATHFFSLAYILLLGGISWLSYGILWSKSQDHLFNGGQM